MAEGLRLKTTTNLDSVLRQFDDWSEQTKTIAMTIAINKLGNQARTAGVRAIHERYGISSGDIKPYFRFTEASRKPLEYVIEARGKGFPLSLFKPRVVRGKGGGVSVLLVGRRVLIPHAFIYQGQVFARGTYNAGAAGPGTIGPKAGKRRKRGIRETSGQSAFEPTGERFGRFAFGRHRFPITLLRTTTPPAALMKPSVLEAMNERIKEQAPKVLKAALRFASRVQ